MIKSHIKTTEKNNEKFKKFMDMIKRHKHAYVTIGIHEDAGRYSAGNASVVEVALWQEFGTRTIPERSFIRSAIDDNVGKINSWREEMINNIVDKGWSVEQALDAIGVRIQILIQNKIKSNVPPPYGSGRKPNDADRIQELQDAKKARGHAPVTLIETSLMLRSVTYKKHIE